MIWMTTVGHQGEEPAWHLLEAPVRVLRLYGKAPEEAPTPLNGKILVFGDEPITFVGDGYKLVRHEEFFGALDNVIRDQWPVSSVETLIGLDGARARVSWTIPRLRRNVGHDVGVTFRIIAFNSYDQSRAVARTLWASYGRDVFRVPRGIGQSRRRYASLEFKDLSKMIDSVVEEANEASNVWRKWRGVSVSRERLDSFLKGEYRIFKEARAGISRFFAASEGTLWDAVHAFSWHATHHVSVKEDRRLFERQERIYRTADKFAKEVV